MTNLIDINEALGNTIEDSEVGDDNGLSHYESRNLAEEILTKFLVMYKADLPEATHMDTMVYAGSQAIPATCNPEDILEKALSYLAAAAKLTEIQAELEAKKEKDLNELLSVINSLLGTAQRIEKWQDMTAGELGAAREIMKIRLDLEAAKTVKFAHGGYATVPGGFAVAD
jgi:hypothetical protein